VKNDDVSALWGLKTITDFFNQEAFFILKIGEHTITVDDVWLEQEKLNCEGDDNNNNRCL
jgi:hypothetical protein